MKFRTTRLIAVALGLVAPVFSPAQAQLQQPEPPAAGSTQDQATAATQTTLPAQSAQPQGSAPLRVMVNKSLLINTTEQIKRISVTDPSVAYATPITPTQILVHGRAPARFPC